MSVVIETTLGDITVDLYLEQRPATCLNFLKLCKMKYYNFNLFHTIRNGFIAQTGDPTGEGAGGESIWGLLEGASKRFFSGEKMPKIRHTDAGLLSMVCTDDMMVGSQFFFTLGPDLDSLDGVHCVIGEVTEGHEVLTKLNDVICDETHRPYQDVRITHTVILEDPFNDLPGLRAPSRSPSPNAERLKGGRIAPDEEIDETQGKSHQEIQEIIEEKEAKARATILEIVGDLPDADIAPPENVLFVCKLNPVTTDDDLEIIFSRFGKIVSCEVIRDKKSGDSLQYAFIEFEDKKSCEDAYFKMDNVLIDDRRIHVDFSQSVSKMRWLGKGRGVQYLNNKPQDSINSKSNKSHSKERERNDSKSQKYKKDRDDLEVRKSDNLRSQNDRSRKRRDSPQNRTKYDKNHSEQSNSKEYRTEKSNNHARSSIKNENSIRHVNDYNRLRKSSAKSSPNRYDKREYSRSPLRNEENKEDKRRDKKEKSNDRHTNKSRKTYKRDGREESTYKEKKHNRDIIKPAHKKSSSQETHEVEPHTPSPVSEKNNLKPNKGEKEKMKTKNNLKSHKTKRKPSTSSSESETSDTSSSSSESSSSSGEDKKKHASKIKKKHTSSSSSSSSTSTSSSTSSSISTSSSSISSSDSSNSSSDSECDKKKPKKNENSKYKKPKKRL